MTILSLDTTTLEGSAALIIDGRVVEERRGDVTRTHAERLPRELVDLAAAHGTSLAAVDLFAVAAGPGSFTGLRIGIATIQGAAFVQNRRVVAVSALDALAHAVAADAVRAAVVGAWMNAHRGEVFASLYEVTDAPPLDPERVRVIESAMVGTPADVVACWAASGRAPIAIVGDGAVKYVEAITSGWPGVRVLEAPLLAGVIGQVAYARARRGETIDPAAIHPVYVRRPDAEIDRDKRIGRSRTS